MSTADSSGLCSWISDAEMSGKRADVPYSHQRELLMTMSSRYFVAIIMATRRIRCIVEDLRHIEV